MKKYTLQDLIERYPVLKECANDIEKVFGYISDAFSSGSKLLIAGNGGSSADAEHISGELLKGFKKDRKVSLDFKNTLCQIDKEIGENISSKIQRSLPAISLSNHQALNTAFINDVPNGGEYCFAQQVFAFGKKGDVLLAISTSGNSKNIINAAVTAKALGMYVVALSGNNGGKLKEFADAEIIVPEKETFVIQELHLPIYHYLCLAIEEKFFGDE